MPLTTLFALLPAVALGIGLGFLGGLFGIGGGIIVIPILGVFYGMEQPTAQGTALVMMVPNLVFAWVRYVQRNPGSQKGAAGIALSAMATTWAAAYLVPYIDQKVLRILFALFLLMIGIRMLRPKNNGVTPATARFPQSTVPLVGVLGGTSMGLLGIGGGLIATPILSSFYGMGQRVAQSMGLALVTPSSVVALATYAGHGRVDWPMGIALALGGSVSVSGGVALAHALNEQLLRRAFGVMLSLTAVVLVVREVG